MKIFWKSKKFKNLKFKKVKYNQKLSSYKKLYFFMSINTTLPAEAYKIFSILEMQISTVLLRAQLVPFFFLIPDLCFYRLIYINSVIISDPHKIMSLFDVIHLPLFLYQLLNYRQNRFYYYPRYLKKFFKTYWGQFIDYTSDKVWLLSNTLVSRLIAHVVPFSEPNIIIYMSPFRRFSKLYYRSQPERSRRKEISLMYTYTVFKLKLFKYISFYK